MKKALLLLVTVCGLFWACEDQYAEPDPATMGYNYYPLEVGEYRIYNVMDIRFQHDVGDTAEFQVRERVDTTFYDQTNTLNYKIIRSIRTDASQAWVDDSVFTVTKSNTNVMLTKHNTRYVRLIFPVKEGKSWLGDAYNEYLYDGIVPDDERRADYYGSKNNYTYYGKGQAYTINGIEYGNTVTVQQGEPYYNSTTGIDDRKEVYAEGVGLVFKMFKLHVYESCNLDVTNGCEFGEEYIIYGRERYEELLEFGKE